MDWFTNPFLGSQVPITYEEEIKFKNPFTDDIEKGIQRKIIGFVYVNNLSKFIQDMQKIFDEVKP